MNYSIKDLISQNYIIVCDTNVYLRLYDYSPEFTEFAITCLDKIKTHLKIAYMTCLEYNKHYRGKYNNAKEKIKKYDATLLDILEDAQAKINKEFYRIEQYYLPDMQVIHKNVINGLVSIKEEIKSYCENHELLIALNEEYLKQDPIKTFWDTLTINIFKSFSFEQIYQICDEGEKRFKNKVPPGFKDKEKQGIRQYGDLILWKELIEFCKVNHVNAIFVTDDVKEDWWEITNSDGNFIREFHSKLTSEFNKETEMEIIAFTSQEFFSIIAIDYDIKKQDTVEMALQQTNDKYVSTIDDDVFNDIQDELLYSQGKYISGYNNIGSEGISEFELVDKELASYEVIEQDENYFVYLLTFQIKLSASSCEYWGRDDDTKEIITSPNNHHIFTGKLQVQIERVIDSFIDLIYEKGYSNPEIAFCELHETEFIEYSEYSEEFDDDQYNICPRCGRKMTFEDDAGNGFCIDCSKTDDTI